MNVKAKKILVFWIVFLLTLSGCSANRFGKLGFKNSSDLTGQLNKILKQEGKGQIPNLANNIDAVDKSAYTSYESAVTEKGLVICTAKDKSNNEAIILTLPLEKRNEDDALNEFVDIIAAIIINFAGVEHVTPIERGMFVNGQTTNGVYYGEYAFGDNVFTLTISVESGYTFTYQNKQ